MEFERGGDKGVKGVSVWWWVKTIISVHWRRVSAKLLLKSFCSGGLRLRFQARHVKQLHAILLSLLVSRREEDTETFPVLPSPSSTA